MSATNKAVYTAIKVACGWGRGSDEKANPNYWAGVIMQQVAQAQYVVSDTRSPVLHDWELV